MSQWHSSSSECLRFEKSQNMHGFQPTPLGEAIGEVTGASSASKLVQSTLVPVSILSAHLSTFLSVCWHWVAHSLSWLQTYSIRKNDLDLLVPLPLPPKSWDYRHVPLCLVITYALNTTLILVFYCVLTLSLNYKRKKYEGDIHLQKSLKKNNLPLADLSTTWLQSSCMTCLVHS